MFDIILFDFDGTVYDTLEGITKCMQHALKKRGIEETLEALHCFAGPPLAEKIPEVYGFDEATTKTVITDFRERYNSIGIYESRVFPEIPELLAKLKKAGKRMGIATSKPQFLAEHLMEKEGIKDYFEVICGSQPDGSLGKKDQVIKAVIEKFGVKDERLVLVGDTKYDVIGAHKCGLPCIGVRYGYAAENELEDACADIIVKDTDELFSVLLK